MRPLDMRGLDDFRPVWEGHEYSDLPLFGHLLGIKPGAYVPYWEGHQFSDLPWCHRLYPGPDGCALWWEVPTVTYPVVQFHACAMTARTLQISVVEVNALLPVWPAP